MKRTVFSVAAATVAMIVSTGVALAVEAVVTRDSPVYRSRTSNAVVNEVDENQIVDVEECRSNRCFIVIPGRDGWIRQSRLAPLDDEGDAQPGVQFQFNIGPGGPGFSIGIGNGGSGGGVSIGSGGASSGARVCLYEHANYAGASRCFSRGTTVNNLTSLGWNDVASSVRVFGGARAQVCEHAGGGGTCVNINGNTSSFGAFNDLATYIDAY